MENRQRGFLEVSANGSPFVSLSLNRLLPGGQTLDLSQAGSWLPVPDGTIFTAPFGPGVVYLRGGAWTLVPFSSQASLDAMGAVSFDANGQPERIWGLSSPEASSHGIYWRTYP